MNELIQWVIAPCILISLMGSVWFSIKSRRTTDVKAKGISSARMNMCMGAMLIFIAAVQLLLSGESTLRVVIGAIFLVIGVFNLFAGIRNQGYYQRLKEQQRQ
ncbi:YtpI family protein [Paenibacillus sp. J5C_2022]|uniref:YtpI family protein n=1 Tax=Paenibacillus sp. J5C2022 TaxID=2977129 RepID=UPI0021D2F901|nr:YtpI family protein [Paenibacillus sp. J5C2022]MCU6712432.1 YtpI family protein [Paenibacillus sp. J5C2022]